MGCVCSSAGPQTSETSEHVCALDSWVRIVSAPPRINHAAAVHWVMRAMARMRMKFMAVSLEVGGFAMAGLMGKLFDAAFVVEELDLRLLIAAELLDEPRRVRRGVAHARPGQLWRVDAGHLVRIRQFHRPGQLLNENRRKRQCQRGRSF